MAITIFVLAVFVIMSASFYIGYKLSEVSRIIRAALDTLSAKEAEAEELRKEPKEPVASAAVIVDPDDPAQQIAFAKAEHEEMLKKLNPDHEA